MSWGDWIGLAGVVLVVIGGLCIYIREQVAMLREETQRLAAERRAELLETEEEMKNQISSVRIQVKLIDDAHHALALEMAKHYVRNEHLTLLENRMFARFDRLEAAIDRMVIRPQEGSRG